MWEELKHNRIETLEKQLKEKNDHIARLEEGHAPLTDHKVDELKDNRIYKLERQV